MGYNPSAPLMRSLSLYIYIQLEAHQIHLGLLPSSSLSCSKWRKQQRRRSETTKRWWEKRVRVWRSSGSGPSELLLVGILFSFVCCVVIIDKHFMTEFICLSACSHGDDRREDEAQRHGSAHECPARRTVAEPAEFWRRLTIARCRYSSLGLWWWQNLDDYCSQCVCGMSPVRWTAAWDMKMGK